MSAQQDLEKAIAALEAQRADLGDSVVDSALIPLREKLAGLSSADGSSSPAGERRVVTILFCDVVGSTTLAEQMDPEVWTGIMNTVFEQLNEPIDRYGGIVARLLGDAILAFFGAPVSHENDPERAILAGLAILENMVLLREQIKQEYAIDFNVRVGINTGLVVAGQVGSAVHGEYTAMGDAVNLAARMEQTAVPGTLQISGDTYRAVAPLFDVEPLGPIAVKGKSEPVPAYRVLGRKAAPGRLRGLEASGLISPLVGRGAELAALERAIADLRDSDEGAVALIFGEAGLGKSTLAAEVRRRSAGENVRWLEGRTLSIGQSLSYWPFREMLWQVAGISEEDDEESAWQKLEDSVFSLFAEQTADILPYLASVLALEVRETYREKVAYLDAEALGRQVYLAARRFFERLAGDQPLILLFDDLHWMDDASARLLEHLLPLVERAPILIMGLSRVEAGTTGDQIARLAKKEYPERTIELQLAPLPPGESDLLVQNLLAVDDLPAHVRRRIVDRAGGNPFFLEEIIRTLIDSGAIAYEPRSGRWRAAKTIATLQLPDTVQGVIIARVDRLSEDVKQVLRTASVVGRSFLYRLLREVMKVDYELDSELATLQEIDLIREKQRQPELEYIFKHALAQEAVYESILLEKRRQLHCSVAETIESAFADRLEEFYGLLAYHYARAEAPQKALDYLLKAGDSAGQVAADAEALAYYRQALAAYEQAFGEHWDPLQRATLERKMGQAFFRRGEHIQARERLALALAYLGQPLPSSRWAIRRGILAEVIRQTLIRLAPGMMRKSGNVDNFADERERLTIYDTLTLMDTVEDQERFMLESLKGLNLWERIGHPPGGFVFTGLAIACVFMGLYGLSRRYNRVFMDLAQRQRHPLDLGFAHYGLLIHNSWLGSPGKAIEHGMEGLYYSRKAGFLRGQGAANFMMAETLLYQGYFKEAESLANENLEIGREGGDAQLEAWGLLQLGFSKRLAGYPEEAIALLHQCKEVARSVPDHLSQLQAWAMIGHCYMDMGRLEAALEAVQEAGRIRQEYNVIGGRFLSMVWIALARAHLMAAEREEGAGREAHLAQARQACREARKSASKYRPFQAAAFRLQGTYDWLNGREVQAGQWWQKSLEVADDIEQPYEEAMTYLEMGKRQGKREYLAQAKAILASLGTRPDFQEKE
jgi:class 3 adenylate cyclase/tetratricopeptide (TPR) repeat protein